LTSRPLYPQGKSHWYPLGRRLGGPQSRSGRGGEEKNSQPPPPEIEPRSSDRPICSQSLYRLSYPGSCKKGTRVYPKVSGLAAWSENYKWYSSLPLGAVVLLFVSQSSELCRHNPLCCFSTSVYCCKSMFLYKLSPETFGYIRILHCSN
jgi:hypothetical protein